MNEHVCCPTTSTPPSKVNRAHINVQSLTSLALEGNWEFPEKGPSVIYGYPSEIKSPFLHRRQPGS